jgi:hypothetical protein
MKAERRASGHSRKAHSQPTRAKFSRMAAEGFADAGNRAATIREVCARAGENRRVGLTHHFGDKVGLYTVCPFGTNI